MRRHSAFYKIKILDHPEYLYKLIPEKALLIIHVTQITFKYIIVKLIFLNINSFLI